MNIQAKTCSAQSNFFSFYALRILQLLFRLRCGGGIDYITSPQTLPPLAPKPG